MTLLMVALIAFFVLFFIAYAGGMLLPKKVAGTKTEWLESPSATVWLIITDHAKENEWRSGVRLVERVPTSERFPLWKETRYGKTVLVLKTIESKTRKKLVREIVNSNELKGTISYTLEEQHEKTKLTITQDIDVLKPLSRYKAQWFSPKSNEIDQYFSDLKQRILFIKERNEQFEEESK